MLRQQPLPPGGRREILAANDEIHAIMEIIHHHTELIRPLAEDVAHGHVALVVLRLLQQRAQKQVLISVSSPGILARTTARPSRSIGMPRQVPGYLRSPSGPLVSIIARVQLQPYTSVTRRNRSNAAAYRSG